MSYYTDFVQESWRIEGLLNICIDKMHDLAEYHQDFSGFPPTVAALCAAAWKFTDNHGQLRNRSGMDVTVGLHILMAGGPMVEEKLFQLCEEAPDLRPYDLHCRFEVLHPFMDGNGRVGRLLWLWSMEHHNLNWGRGFLHNWYYQSLRVYNETP